MPATTPSRSWRRAASVLGLSAVMTAATACLHLGGGIEARESWTRSYTVKPGATLSVIEGNGKIRVEAADIDKIEVVATRISTASTEEAAKADLKAYSIAEKATPDRVELDSSNRSLQMLLPQSRRVDYDIKVPRSLNVTLKTANGSVDVQGVGGALTIEATNGEIDATGLSGGADVSALNGKVSLSFAKIHDAGVRCKTTNGEIVIAIPNAAKATISARVMHGQIETQNLTLQATEESRQRLNATIGGGGPEIKLETTNGEVRVVGKTP